MSELEAARSRVRELEEKQKTEQEAKQAELRTQYEKDLAALRRQQSEAINALKESFRKRGLPLKVNTPAHADA